MHRSRHPVESSIVVDDDNDDDGSPEPMIPSSTSGDYSSLIVNSPSDTMYHRIRSPSPTSSYSLNHHNSQQNQSSTSPEASSSSTNGRHIHHRLSRSASQPDLNGSTHNAHRDRIRFNTWPRHRNEKRDIFVEYDKRLAKSVIQELGIGINKTYRNPWGNLSYAQLITRAIDSSPWKRLTLNEVYEWIIKFVPYFKDKIDAKTSWGWKNSIRHNLSLHNQFIRVPVISSLSKGPVKYVWTINPSFKNNSPYKKYSLKRKRAAAAAALASQAAAAAAAVAASSMNSVSPSMGSSQEHHSPTSTPSQPLVNMSNNYHRQSLNNSSSPSNLAKATRLSEQHGQTSSSSTLNQLSVAAAMMSAGVTDPAAYRAFLNSQAAVMMNKHKQNLSSSSSLNNQSSSMMHRPTQSNTTNYTHEPGLPVPKKVALGNDRFKQPQQQDWLLSSYRQQAAAAAAAASSHPSFATRQSHSSSGTNKMMVNQQRSPYLNATPPSNTSATRINSEMNNMSANLSRRNNSPPNYPSAAAMAAAAAQNKLLAQTKLWHAAVQAAAAQAHQQQYHHQATTPTTSASSASANTINELQNYINRSHSKNGLHSKMSPYLNPETLKLLSSAAASKQVDEQHHYRNDPRYKLMRSSYQNATSGSLSDPHAARQRIHSNNSSGLTQQQQLDMVSTAYNNYKRRSSGFASTANHDVASDDENEGYVQPRKDSSTSNGSSGYESGLAINRQSPSASSSVRTGSGSSITSEPSSASYYPHGISNTNGSHHSKHHPRKIPRPDPDLEIDEQQQFVFNTVGGYVDDLMERIRKMPPKKRSKFYQMLDEERLKDVNNNHSDDRNKSKHDDVDDEEHEHQMNIDVSMPLVIPEAVSDEDEDRTIVALEGQSNSVHLNQNVDQNQTKDSNSFPLDTMTEFNDKSFEELLSMGVPLAVLKAIAFQQHRTQNKTKVHSQLANFLNKKCALSTDKNATEKSNLLNARTILRKILQKQQKHGKNEKPLVEAMDYSSDENANNMVDDDDDDEDDRDEVQSTSMLPRHRNVVRSNSHNPVTMAINPTDIASLSPPTSTSSSPDETDVQHQSSPNSISRPSSTPATLVSSACPY